MSEQERAFSYEEPVITIILTESSFLFFLNIVNSLFDKLLHCGLVSQILLGVAYGTPGLQWLDQSSETFITQLGYIGLLLLVFEGGLSTNISALKSNIGLSLGVAATGICLPIGLSYLLMIVIKASPLQAFAAGASLCSTSLGTTFTLLESTALQRTRMGVVLTSAAMLDDVFGLVMVQVVSSVGSTTQPSTSKIAAAVLRPIFVSVAFALLVPQILRYTLRLVLRVLTRGTQPSQKHLLDKLNNDSSVSLLLQSSLLIGIVTAASFAGTSTLFASYVAGASLNWLEHAPGGAISTQPSATPGIMSNKAIFDKYFKPPLERVLKPFFYASVGFAIPITEMFDDAILWRGIVYTALMIIGKLACGCWLIRFPWYETMPGRKFVRPVITSFNEMRNRVAKLHCQLTQRRHQQSGSARICAGTQELQSLRPTRSCLSLPARAYASGDFHHPVSVRASSCPPLHVKSRYRASSIVENSRKPQTLYPASILGLAMVSRGEIGFLISSLSFTAHVIDKNIFLVVTWAIMLCTIVGPIGVGLVVKRLRRLERRRADEGIRRNVLGPWGVD